MSPSSGAGAPASAGIVRWSCTRRACRACLLRRHRLRGGSARGTAGIGTGLPDAVPGRRAEALADTNRSLFRSSVQDTIVAISTPPGRGGIGVVRLSGAEARSISARILRFPHPPEWRSWGATLAELGDIDRVVVSFF